MGPIRPKARTIVGLQIMLGLKQANPLILIENNYLNYNYYLVIYL